MKNVLLKLKALFNSQFGDYNISFEKADTKIQKMNEAVRMRYYNDARELNNNTAFIGEIEELMRVYYQKLALTTLNETEVFAHRLTLIAIDEFRKRIHTLGGMYRSPNGTNSLDKLK